jgi:hypothetical protein
MQKSSRSIGDCSTWDGDPFLVLRSLTNQFQARPLNSDTSSNFRLGFFSLVPHFPITDFCIQLEMLCEADADKLVRLAELGKRVVSLAPVSRVANGQSGAACISALLKLFPSLTMAGARSPATDVYPMKRSREGPGDPERLR